MDRYRFNDHIFVEFDPFLNRFYHYNTKSQIIKMDKVSSFVINKLIDKKLTPIPTEELYSALDKVTWKKFPPLLYVTLKASVNTRT